MAAGFADMWDTLAMHTFALILAEGMATVTMHTAMDLTDARVHDIMDVIPAILLWISQMLQFFSGSHKCWCGHHSEQCPC